MKKYKILITGAIYVKAEDAGDAYQTAKSIVHNKIVVEDVNIIDEDDSDNTIITERKKDRVVITELGNE